MHLQRDSDHFQNILLSIKNTKLTGKVPKMIENIVNIIDIGNLLNDFPAMISQHNPKLFRSFQSFMNICKVLSSAYVLIKTNKL